MSPGASSTIHYRLTHPKLTRLPSTNFKFSLPATASSKPGPSTQHNFMLHLVPIYSTAFTNTVNLYISAISYYHKLNKFHRHNLVFSGNQSPAGPKAFKWRQFRQSITYYKPNTTKTPCSPACSMPITLRN